MFGDEYSYCHIGTQPNQLVDADSCMADDVMEQFEKMAKEDENGMLEFPNALIGIPSVQTVWNGPSYKLKW